MLLTSSIHTGIPTVNVSYQQLNNKKNKSRSNISNSNSNNNSKNNTNKNSNSYPSSDPLANDFPYGWMAMALMGPK